MWVSVMRAFQEHRLSVPSGIGDSGGVRILCNLLVREVTTSFLHFVETFFVFWKWNRLWKTCLISTRIGNVILIGMEQLSFCLGFICHFVSQLSKCYVFRSNINNNLCECESHIKVLLELPKLRERKRVCFGNSYLSYHSFISVHLLIDRALTMQFKCSTRAFPCLLDNKPRMEFNVFNPMKSFNISRAFVKLFSHI